MRYIETWFSIDFELSKSERNGCAHICALIKTEVNITFDIALLFHP